MRTPPTWRPEFDVGHPLLDQQHQKLLELTRAVVDSLRNSPVNRSEFHALLSDLVVLMNEHFDEEEALLAKNNAPDLAQHCKEHDRYREQLVYLSLDAMNAVLTPTEIIEFLDSWLVTHLQGTDKASAHYLKP